jgi:hypothetical protein
MQILSPSRRSCEANRRDGLRTGLRFGERVCGLAAEDNTLQGRSGSSPTVAAAHQVPTLRSPPAG